ncbi:MAG: hypothetical protein JW934_11380 [Anaerolineae bacterium]|nr:hypothetical protein [Anaerolineae bacterium]
MSKAGCAFRIILCIIAGAIVSLILAGIGRRMSIEGYLARWNKLPQPSVPLMELLAGTPNTIYAKGIDTTVYSCSDYNNQCWIQDEIPNTLLAELDKMDIQNVKPCNYADIEFAWFMNSPDTIVDCIQGTRIHIDCFHEFAYVLDQNSDVWKWGYWACFNGSEVIGFFCLGSLGAIVGTAVGTWVFLRKFEATS